MTVAPGGDALRSTVANPANEIELEDLRRLARSDSPDLAEALLTFLQQPEAPFEGAPAEGALTLEQFLPNAHDLKWVHRSQRRENLLKNWKTYLAQTAPPPPLRFGLADLLDEIDARDSDAGRTAILAMVRQADLVYGLWAGLKRIYKRAEERLDAELFGALAWRFDVEASVPRSREVGLGTLKYLRRRASRFLRQLGRELPGLYPQFAVQVLRHYSGNVPWRSLWVVNHIWLHESDKQSRNGFAYSRLPEDLLKHRAFDASWKRSPEPLLQLVELAESEPVTRFAIQGLRRDFADSLRHVTPAWLERLAAHPFEATHAFLVELLEGAPEFHRAKLRGLGLHDAVLRLLTSPSQKARAYAVDYARAHAQDLSAEALVALFEVSYKETRGYAAAAVQSRDPRALGCEVLGRLLSITEVTQWAGQRLDDKFDRTELGTSFVGEMIYGSVLQRTWALKHLAAKYSPGEITPGFWTKLLDDPRSDENAQAVQVIVQALAKFPASAIGTKWLLDALVRPRTAAVVGGWIAKADQLPGLDVERVKGLVFNPAHRPTALAILGNTKLVSARELGLPWLLALTRRADPSLNQFAQKYLLHHMKPADFGETADGTSARDARDTGVARLFALATGAKEPETVRVFAQTYLRCHHPGIGPEQTESKAYHIRPAVPRDAYTSARVWAGNFDPRPDVRRFAVVLTRVELRNWGAQSKVYELCESEHKEVRNVGYDALLRAGDPDADKQLTLTPEELDPTKVIALTESRKKSTREVAMELVRKHYARLGGSERLGWLMASPDREVRLFSVRLLWERHRPRQLPAGWKPKGKSLGEIPPTEPFADVDALRDFLRRVMFGIAPGRMERRDDNRPRRHVTASEAKRNVVEVMRDLGMEDGAFARVVAPVLGECTGSLAMGEWQACLAALVRLRGRHPEIELGARQ